MKEATMPISELHEPINWLLTRKHIIDGEAITGLPARAYVLNFTCQECKKKYTRIVDKETFEDVVVDKTAWEWGWNNDS